MLKDLRSVFRRTALRRKRLTLGPKGTVVVHGIEDLLPAWEAARELVPVTGRWPVLVTSWGDESPWDRVSDAPSASDLELLDRAARTTDPWWSPVQRGEWPVTAEQTPYLARGWSGVDVAIEAGLQVGPGTTRDDLDWWIYQRVVSDPALVDRVVRGAGLVVRKEYWFTPDNAVLLLLPTPSPWLAAGWLSYHGTLGKDNVLAAVLWEWHDDWGAELVACWDTMLQFKLGRRPPPGRDAWNLAGQMKFLARNLDMNRWELAVVLSHADTLFLHDRP